MAAATGVAYDPDMETVHVSEAPRKNYQDLTRTLPVTWEEADKGKSFATITPTTAPQTSATGVVLEFKSKSEKQDTSHYSQVRSMGDSAQGIVRAHFASEILGDLKHIEANTGEVSATSYVNGFLNGILLFRDQSPHDPYLEILMSLYDAMVYENRWLNYDSAQYLGAHKILFSYASQRLDNSKVSKAIVKLHELGFDTTPFAIDPTAFEDLDDANEEADY